MKTTTLCGALAVLAAPAMVAGLSLISAAAQAQDYTSGALLGTVSDSNGKVVAGASVTLYSQALGQSRTFTTNASGGFSAIGLQPGAYDLTVSANGYDDYKTSVTIVVSQEVRIDAALRETGAAATTVVVKAHRVRQDFAKTTTGLSVDLDTLTAQTPVARNLTAVTMLAPTVTMGNPGFGKGDRAVASFGGGSVAENAYYIDGLNITNPDTYVSSARVPFDFYKTVEVKTGGYPAEFGRATGGVVNATTKSGSNTFMFAVHGNYQPMNFRNDQLDTYDYAGKFSKVKNNSLSVEAGGPIIKDHLFAYGLYQFNDYESTSGGLNTGTYTDTKNTDPFMGLKLDGYITPSQHISLTYFDTTNTDKSSQYAFDGATVGAYKAATSEELGGKNWVLNYAGKVTDWFSVSAAVGDMKDRDNQVPSDTASHYVFVRDRGNTPSTLSVSQPNNSVSIDSMERKFWRADGDIRVDAFGRHHIRFGIDHEKNSETKTQDLTGDVPVEYEFRNGVDYASDVASPIDLVNDNAKLEIIYEHLGGNVASENQAEYLQDSWDVTPDLNLQIGVRNDNFKQFNLSGQQYMDLKNNIAPRLGFSWDPTGEGNWKIFGSYGRNFIPPAMNLGFRGKDLYYIEYFNAPTGGWQLDSATGLPKQVGTPYAKYDSACPTSNLGSASGFSGVDVSGNYCYVYGNGTQEGANSKTAENLKATGVDEVILGATYKIDDLWSVGLTGTLRSTKNISEDSDFTNAIIAYLDANGLDSSQYTSGEISNNYYVWNVGDHAATIRLKEPLPGQSEQSVITLSADQLGHFHNAKREYQALTFDFKRAFDGKWGLQGSYTWSRLSGNYSGTVVEYGNTVQDDAGATYAWDSPGMENYSGGLLPGDRTHTFKVWGSYQFTPNFLAGFNAILQSPEHFSCLGLNVDDSYAYGYGDVSHYCGGKPAPQGKGLKSDWTKNIDLSLRYTVPDKYALAGKLVLRADVFNVFDTHSVVTRYVTYDGQDEFHPDSGYGTPTNYNTPRYVRVGFDLSY